jgi:hypothetical protein
MHLELPKVRLESLKDFFKHYLMIVLSILTALGLEAWIEHAHHQHAAETARAQMEAEIRTNLTEVRSSIAKDAGRAKALQAIRDAVVEDFQAHAPDETIARHIQSLVRADGYNLNLNWPTLRHEAWDVAVANQSASWIDDARMRRYSAAYAAQRDFTYALNANLALLIDGSKMIDTITDLRTGSVQPREFLHVISQMYAMLDQAQGSLRTLQKPLEDALADSPER